MNRNPSMAGLASLVQSRGRNGDSVLVHMTPGEVQGLQSLALAHGGSLTINPDTGLVEANFLKKLLPTLLGFGLNFLFPGLGALGSGLLVGAGETIRTGGDLGKGLMAGLGAFGGAGIGSALSGAAKAGSEAALQEVTTTAAQKAAAEAAKNTATQAATETAKQGLFNLNPNMAGTLQNYGQGIKALGNQFGREGFMSAIPGGTLGKGAMIMSAANALTPEMEVPEGGAYNIDDSYYQSYGYDPAQGRFLGGQWRKGYPGFPPTGMAMGGQVSPPPNYSYPQAGITKSNYAPSLEYIKPREILDGYDTKIDPFTGAEGFADGGAVGVAPEQNIQAQLGPQSLEQYYQGLLSAPQAPAANPAFGNYLQSLNQFVTSPVAPPPPPAAAPPSTPGTPTTPGGGTNTGGDTGGGGQRWDPTLGKFVPGTGSPGDTGIDLSGLADLVNSGMFPGFNFGDLGNYLQNGGYGDTSGLTWDPSSGTFRQLGSQTVNTPPGQDMSPAYSGLENFPTFDMGNYAQDTLPNYRSSIPEFNFTAPDMTYGQAMAQGNLTDIGQFADPYYAGGAQGFGMGDMAPYGQQFQGFQSAPTDFGSTYQPPAMQTPSLDMMAYSQQPTDFGSMGNYGLGALGTTYQTPTFQMPSMDYGMQQTPAVPTTSFSTPMTTGMPSTGATAPQYGYGNSDVLYGQSMLGGDDANIFGFAGGGAIQKAAAGKLVTGDGDGMSDDIRANINGDQEARLADGEFVIPADVVSHLGNGSTDAGADRLYSMMDRIRKARTGRKQQAPEIDAEKYLPA